MVIVELLASVALIALVISPLVYLFNRMANKERDAHWDSCMHRLEPILTDYSDDRPTPETTSNEINHETMDQQQSHNPESRALLENALESIGCRYDETPDGYLTTKFQGEKFLFDFSSPYMRIWDLGWLDFDITDPTWGTLQLAINRANFSFGPKVVYAQKEPDTPNMVMIHSVCDILFISAIPDIAEYLKSTLTLFFTKKESVRSAYIDIIDEEKKNSEVAWPDAFENPLTD